VLLGIAAVRTGWYLRRRAVAVAAAVASLLTAAVVVGGMVPARYPGDLRFVVPATAITLVVYALAQAPWGHALARVDRALRRSAAHTLGLFLAHYGAYAGLRRAGLLGDVPPAVAVPAAAATTVMLCVVAPHVPQPAWSVRTGRRRPRPHPAYPASGVSRRAIAP
jgi:peptidoglycan/LPS O-acetylase OafA/YrhL